MMEVAQAHMPWGGEEEAKERIIETLRLVHIPEPDKRYSEYPPPDERRHAPEDHDSHGSHYEP